MVVKRRSDSESSKPRRPPATTPEGRENQMVSLAVELAEKQLRDGTATAQVVTHYLKLGSTREKLEQQRLERENKLLDAKVKAMESDRKMESLVQDAINAMRSYSGHSEPQEYNEEFDD